MKSVQIRTRKTPYLDAFLAVYAKRNLSPWSNQFNIDLREFPIFSEVSLLFEQNTPPSQMFDMVWDTPLILPSKVSENLPRKFILIHSVTKNVKCFNSFNKLCQTS